MLVMLTNNCKMKIKYCIVCRINYFILFKDEISHPASNLSFPYIHPYAYIHRYILFLFHIAGKKVWQLKGAYVDLLQLKAKRNNNYIIKDRS